jgi:uncharacterized protein
MVFDFPVVDVWANPTGMIIPEVARLFEQSHADMTLLQRRRTPDEIIAMMDEAGVSHICLAAWHRPGQVICSNAEVAEYTRAYPDRIFGLASVNLEDPVSAVKEFEHYTKHEGFKGLRVVPWLWNRPPTDAHYWPLFVKSVELNVPFFTQVGHTGPLCPSETGRPVPYIDEIALKFPDLKIVCGHTGYPWTAEMIGVAWKHKNVYIDTSAWSPKYYPPELMTFANTYGRCKVLFGTNFPQLGWKECVDTVEAHLVKSGGLRAGVLKDFMGGNALKMLGIGHSGGSEGRSKM